eukprot:12803038-Alexandrium_andersonii.AAC.1
MSAPTRQGWAALLRLARYFLWRPRAVYHFSRQDAGEAITVYVDTDFAGCLTTWRSTSGGVCACGLRALMHWSVTQKTIALSS